MDDKRKTGIIATIAATVVCGCPGLFMVCIGSMMALLSRSPDTESSGGLTPETALGGGIAGLCLGILFVIIPIAVGFVMLRKKPAAAEVSNPYEPIPPAI